MKEFQCRIKQSMEMQVKGEATDSDEFLLYVNDLVKNQPKVEILLPQDGNGNQITDDTDNPPYTVTIGYVSFAHIDPQFVEVVSGTLEELTPNIIIDT